MNSVELIEFGVSGVMRVSAHCGWSAFFEFDSLGCILRINESCPLVISPSAGRGVREELERMGARDFMSSDWLQGGQCAVSVGAVCVGAGGFLVQWDETCRQWVEPSLFASEAVERSYDRVLERVSGIEAAFAARPGVASFEEISPSCIRVQSRVFNERSAGWLMWLGAGGRELVLRRLVVCREANAWLPAQGRGSWRTMTLAELESVPISASLRQFLSRVIGGVVQAEAEDASDASAMEAPKLKRWKVTELGLSAGLVAILLSHGYEYADQLKCAHEVEKLLGMNLKMLASLNESLGRFGIKMELDRLSPEVAHELDPDLVPSRACALAERLKVESSLKNDSQRGRH